MNYFIYFFISCSIFLTGVFYSFQFTSFVYPKEIVLGLFILFLLPFLWAKNTGKLDLRFVGVFLLMGFICCVSAFFAKVPELTLLRVGEISLVFMACIGICYFYNDVSIEKYLFWGVWASGLTVSILTILQSFDLVPVLLPSYSYYKQVYSVMGNQILVGGYLALCVLWILERYEELEIDYIWVGLFLFISVVGLFLTNSRSAWVAFIVPYLVICILSTKWKLSTIKVFYSIATVILGTFLVLPKIFPRIFSSFSSQDVGFWIRMWIYEGSFRMIKDRFPWGVGFGNYYYWSPIYLGESARTNFKFFQYCNELLTLHAHCDYLELVAELGVISCLVFLFFYFSWFIKRRISFVWISWLILSLFNSVLLITPLLYISLLSVLVRNGKEVILLSGFKRKVFVGIYSLLSMAIIVFLFISLWQPDYRLRQAEKKFLLGIECVEDYEMLMKGYCTPPLAYEGLASAYISKGEYEKAYKVLLNGLRVLDTGSVYILLGRCALSLGKELEAIRWYTEALIRFPKNKEALDFLKSRCRK